MADEVLRGTAALLPFVKKHLRVSTVVMDDEVEGLISAALDDMSMRGVDSDKVCPADAEIGDMLPLGLRAIVYYAKASFGMALSTSRSTSSDSDLYWDRYDGLTRSMSHAEAYRLTEG